MKSDEMGISLQPHLRVAVHDAADAGEQQVLVERLPVGHAGRHQFGRAEVVGGAGGVFDPTVKGRIVLVHEQ